MMPMKKTILSLFLAVAAFPAAAQEFETLFDDFAKEAQEEQNRFLDEANKKFADFLKESWQEFQVFAGKEYPRKPKPKTAPVAAVETTATLESEPATILPGKRECEYSFYGRPVKLTVPDAIANYRMSCNSEKEIARFWETLAESDYQDYLAQLRGYASDMGLEGWSLYLLAENCAKTVFGSGCEDEMEVFKTFILNQIGLDAKMGLADGRLRTMVCIKEQVYARLFCESEGRKYYFEPDVKSVKELRSYYATFADNLSPVSVEISRPMHLGSKETVSTVLKSSTVFGTDISLPINTAQCDFYLDFPQVDVDVYARAYCDGAFTSALIETLRPLVSGKDEVSQVNMLLKFLQCDFNYSTDEDQFGYEKPFFLEENFIYQANDCEDRSILFSFLVRKLLGLDVVLLDYPDHIVPAVCFNKEVHGDSFLHNGRRFTVCDPTYIGTSVGMAMEDYRDIEFNVLTL